MRSLQSVSTVDALELVKLAENACDPNDRTLLAGIQSEDWVSMPGTSCIFNGE
jgi:hypothetical protein